jgi:hypothetical protein
VHAVEHADGDANLLRMLRQFFKCSEYLHFSFVVTLSETKGLCLYDG